MRVKMQVVTKRMEHTEVYEEVDDAEIFDGELIKDDMGTIVRLDNGDILGGIGVALYRGGRHKIWATADRDKTYIRVE